MIDSMVVTWIIASAAAFLALAAPAADVRSHGCPPQALAQLEATPRPDGPMRLEFVSCVEFSSTPFPIPEAVVSPDGARVVHWHNDADGSIEIARLGHRGRVSLSNRVSFRNIARLMGNFGAARDALVWSSDSRGLWSVRQQTMRPSGWSLSGLDPIRIGVDGEVRELPRLRHANGPLDAIMWIGGEGLALAQFGTNGSYYRPEHSDSAPTLAFVDAASGTVLDAVRVDRIAALQPRLRAHGVMVQGATGTVLPNGRVRAVIQFGPWGERPAGTPPGGNWEPIRHPANWLVLTQGERPQTWIPPFADRINPAAFSADGSRLLVMRMLQPEGTQVHCRIPCPHLQRWPRPVTGSIAELLDARSGRRIWQLAARVDQFWNQDFAPSISPDSRYGLVEMPPENGRVPIALVRMTNGRIVQRITAFHVGSYPRTAGFSRDGRRVWVVCGNMVLIYALN